MKLAFITGATSGIGKATAIDLARRGFELVFTARDIEKGKAAEQEILKFTDIGSVNYILCDLSSLQQVRNCVDIFKDRYHGLDVLINNAGLQLPEKRITADGLEETFEVNYLSHFLLTHLLLDDLKQVPEARIINVSSGLYRRGVFDPFDLQGEQSYSPAQAYDNTKLMNILFTQELAERLRGTSVTVNAVNPGVVRTNFAHEQKGFRRFMIRLASPFFLSPEKGAESPVYLAASDEVRNVTGKYFDKKEMKEPESEYITEENRKTLWEKSMELSGLSIHHRV